MDSVSNIIAGGVSKSSGLIIVYFKSGGQQAWGSSLSVSSISTDINSIKFQNSVKDSTSALAVIETQMVSNSVIFLIINTADGTLKNSYSFKEASTSLTSANLILGDNVLFSNLEAIYIAVNSDTTTQLAVIKIVPSSAASFGATWEVQTDPTLFSNSAGSSMVFGRTESEIIVGGTHVQTTATYDHYLSLIKMNENDGSIIWA